MRRADLISSGLLAVGGLLMIFVVIPGETGHGATYGLPAAFFPDVSAVALTAIMGAFFVYRAIPRTQGEPTEDPAPITRSNWQFLAGIAALCLAVYAALAYLGFIAGGILAVASFMILTGERRPVRIVLVSAGVPAAIYLVVAVALRIPLP